MQESDLQTLSREAAYLAINTAELADSTKAQYRKAIDNYLDTGAALGDAQALTRYASQQKSSTRAFLKAAVRLVSREYTQALKAGATPENVDQVRAGLYRFEALQSAIKTPAHISRKAYTWLSTGKVQALMGTCGDDIVGQRNWIVLALLVGAGLRREEHIHLCFNDIQEQYTRDGKRRMVLNVKGTKDRLVPISDILARRLAAWQEITGDGLIARSLGRKKELGESISAIGIFNIVRKHGAMIDEPELAPHDLRRTYAQLGFEAGVSLAQISMLLGHATIATTQRYLNLELDLDQTVSDFIPL